MTVPKITSELIQRHEALKYFFEYIQTSDPEVRPDEIVLSNEEPGDGIVTMNRTDDTGEKFFSAALDGSRSSGALTLNRGHQNKKGELVFDETLSQNVTHACKELHALGGEEQDSFQCPGLASSALIFSRNAVRLGEGWLAIESGRIFFKLKSPTDAILRKLRPLLRLTGSNEIALAEGVEKFWVPTLGPGILGVVAGETISDQLGLDSNYHHQERFALDIVSAYGAMQGMRWYLRRSNAPNISLPSFGAGLLTSAFVDATLGQIWEEGSRPRQFARVVASFLPAVYRMAVGDRSLTITKSRVGSAISRYGTKFLEVCFGLDVGYMILHRLSSSNNLETGLDNQIYRRATQLQSEDQNLLAWLLHGAAGILAPALTERYLVGAQYVDQARRDLEAQAANTVGDASAFLRNALSTGPAGLETDPRFYRELDVSWLRSENKLEDIKLSDGRRLPVAGLAELLSNPTYRRVIEGLDHDRQIGYVQRKFSSYRLSPENVEATFALLNWQQQTRQDLSDLRNTAGSEQRAFAACFDDNAALRPSQEQALLGQLFPGQNPTAQILAARQNALKRRILELRASDPSGNNPQLAAYSRVAREIGLMDAEGQLVPGEETRLAQASIALATPKKHETHGRFLLGPQARSANSQG